MQTKKYCIIFSSCMHAHCVLKTISVKLGADVLRSTLMTRSVHQHFQNRNMNFSPTFFFSNNHLEIVEMLTNIVKKQMEIVEKNKYC